MEPVTMKICKSVIVPSFVKHKDSENALPWLEPFITTRYEMFGEEKYPEVGWITFYYVYRMSVATRESLLKFAGYIIAHLSVFAFLFQVFQEDKGTIMKICCYTQLGLLVLCFTLYLASFLLDGVSMLMIKKSALEYERIALRGEPDISTGLALPKEINDEPGVHHKIFGVRHFELDSYDKKKAYMLGEDEGIIFHLLNIFFALALIVIECLTIVYVYNNTQ